MISKYIIILIATSILNACTVSEDWEPSTIEEQMNHAGAVIYGVADSVHQDTNNFSHYVHLRNATFFKGCGPSYVRINGFTSSAQCGVDPPQVGDRIIVFVCRDGHHWKLNNINVFTGSINGSFSNLQRVIMLGRAYPRCNNCRVRYSRCTKPLKPIPLPDLPIQRLERTTNNNGPSTNISLP